MEAAGVSNNWVEFDRLICVFMELVMQELFEKSIKALFSFSDSCCPFWVWLHLVMFVSYWQMGPFLVMSIASLEYAFINAKTVIQPDFPFKREARAKEYFRITQGNPFIRKPDRSLNSERSAWTFSDSMNNCSKVLTMRNKTDFFSVTINKYIKPQKQNHKKQQQEN